MPIRVTQKQFRTDESINWFDPEVLDPAIAPYSLSAHPELTGTPVTELSEDKLSRTKVFTFPDTVNLVAYEKSSPGRIEFLTSAAAYIKKNNIYIDVTIETI